MVARHCFSGLLLGWAWSSVAAQAAFEGPAFQPPFKPPPALVAEGKFAFAEALTDKLTRQGSQSAGVLADPCGTTLRSTLTAQSSADCKGVVGSNLTFGNFTTNFAPIVVQVNIGPSRLTKRD